MDISGTIVPKSDQLNADDLIAGPKTIRITRVTANESSVEQPVNIYYDGDGGKPYRPCKSMRRVMVSAWGADASVYAGRSMTLYRDASVTWGGMEVGGIRISHLSHLDKEMVMALTASKKARKIHNVLPLKVEPAKGDKVAEGEKVARGVDSLRSRISAAATRKELDEITADAAVVKQRQWLLKNQPQVAEAITQEIAARAIVVAESAPMTFDTNEFLADLSAAKTADEVDGVEAKWSATLPDGDGRLAEVAGECETARAKMGGGK